MKVLIVNKLYYPWIGGIETFVRQIAEGAKKDNAVEVSVLCCQAKGKTKKEIIDGVSVLRASSWGIVSSMPISFSFFYYFKKMIKEVDVIDLQHPFPLAFLAVYLFRPKIKMVVHYHSDIVRQKIGAFLLKPIIQYVLKKAKKIIVSNPNIVLSSDVLKKFTEKCRVVRFGVDFEEVQAQEDISLMLDIKKRFGRFILFVGRLNYYKGLNYLLSAMRSIDCNLVIIGKGEEKNNLLKQILELDLEKQVFIIDNVSRKELINYHFVSEFFVLPSVYKSETFGLVLLDAMACGKPVITTDLGTGTSYVNINGETGIVVPPKNSRSIHTAIKLLLDNKNLKIQYGEDAKKKVLSKFNLQDIIKENLNIFRSL